MTGEFAFIGRLLAPLSAKISGAAGLKNDAAVLDPPAGHSIVATADTLVEGVHFIGDEPAASLAAKALAVNLSDLAAMGAAPWCYLLTLSLPDKNRQDIWLSEFVSGLARQQERYDVTLIGGDTTGTSGPLVISVTAMGTVETGRCLTRSGARPGDHIWVSGTIGDARLGLCLLDGAIVGFSSSDGDWLLGRYREPIARVELGRAILERGLATAALDLSDGLIADLGHILAASGVGGRVELARLPLSPAAEELLRSGLSDLQDLATGGDDYELCFTAPPECRDKLEALARELAVPLTPIGEILASEGLEVLGGEGESLIIDREGWSHF